MKKTIQKVAVIEKVWKAVTINKADGKSCL